MTLSEETIFTLNDGIEKTIDLFLKDNKCHDFSIGLIKPSLGLTIHTNTDEKDLAYEKLIEHCNTRKYLEKADNWFGLCLDPFTKEFKFGVMINKEWSYSKDQGENISM
ncbi:hypothetical protein [Francisella orientalis]|uniref:Uncharacterized protein n=1 Tax=Francisella orientalis TaxID=299583 RepID=A0AAP7FSU8_9GAMM|nr:hypothetical protein [Francisella orientalis]AFJ43647.1 NERD domain-containing protein [Francisella orientalis str. Toba 04]AHB99126.1 hypothetical protein M973_03790 [Francisella orientalis LADL 07-285A]MBK2005356.1 hypothetical protein [Francisella orientalis]MBK2007183.1 hypothetical protein [Francisella orientalis]MBK2008750.1 hypothetical protein [Francisella orientalis]